MTYMVIIRNNFYVDTNMWGKRPDLWQSEIFMGLSKPN